jgi:hypothetical protein
MNSGHVSVDQKTEFLNIALLFGYNSGIKEFNSKAGLSV